MGYSEEDVIRSAVKKISDCGYGRYHITQWPDKNKKNRNSPEIDAIAEAAENPPLAIEHTRVESFVGQLMDDNRVKLICIPLENEIARDTPMGLSCTIPTLAFIKGFDWNFAANALKSYIIRKSQNFPNGFSSHSIAGVPFRLRIYNDPIKKQPFHIVREKPNSSMIEKELMASMEKALFHKWERLNDYSLEGYIPMLIIESNDAFVINHIDIYQAFLDVQKMSNLDHLEIVMYGMTANTVAIEWLSLKGDSRILDCVNPSNFLIGPSYADYWNNDSG